MTSFTKILASLINYLAQTTGRQKLCRFVQYFCLYLTARYQKFYQIHIHQRNSLKSNIVKTQVLSGAMAMCRKILRFGPSITCLKTIVNNIKELSRGQNKEPTHIVIMKTLSAMCIALFFVADHYIWFFRVGIVNNQPLKLQLDYYSVLGWLLDNVINIIKNITLYVQMDEKERPQKVKELAVDMSRVVLDVPVALYFLKPGTVDASVAGLLGAVTSFIGGYQMWK